MWVFIEFSSGTGAVNAIVFGLDKDTRSKLTVSQIKVGYLDISIELMAEKQKGETNPVPYRYCMFL